MTTVSDNTISLTAGDSLVYLKQEARDRAYPLGFDTTWTKGEWTRLINRHHILMPGDVLSFPYDFGQAWVEVELATVKLWNYWEQTVARNFPGYQMTAPALTLRFLTRVTCPHCDTDALHDAEMPDLEPDPQRPESIWRCYVLRSCITCTNSWSQEVDW